MSHPETPIKYSSIPKEAPIKELNEAEKPEKKVIKIGEQFWKKLRGALRVDIGNPEYVDIVFRSKEKRITEAMHRITLISPIGHDEWVIIGNYDPVDGSIHFNIGQEDVPKEELARVITHEIVHKLQDEAGKFPEMGKKKRLDQSGVDTESPWEEEAYRIQELLYRDFIQHCEIY